MVHPARQSRLTQRESERERVVVCRTSLSSPPQLDSGSNVSLGELLSYVAVCANQRSIPPRLCLWSAVKPTLAKATAWLVFKVHKLQINREQGVCSLADFDPYHSVKMFTVFKMMFSVC